MESAAWGRWLGLTLAARAQGRELPDPPATTALGALLRHLRTPARRFQPSNVHFGLFPDLAEKSKKKARKAVMAERGREDFRKWREGGGYKYYFRCSRTVLNISLTAGGASEPAVDTCLVSAVAIRKAPSSPDDCRLPVWNTGAARAVVKIHVSRNAINTVLPLVLKSRSFYA